MSSGLNYFTGIYKQRDTGGLSRFAHKTPKIAREAIFCPANSRRPKVRKTAPDNRDFALLIAQKPISATGRQTFDVVVFV
jgi:hypothetical protein